MLTHDVADWKQAPSARKLNFLRHTEATIGEQAHWRTLNSAYYDEDRAFMRFLVPRQKRVLELGCGRGDLLAALDPSHGVGIDFSPSAIDSAKSQYSHLSFIVGDVEDPDTLSAIEGPFDYIVISDTIGMFEKIDETLRTVQRLCSPETRLIIAYYSHLWEPILKIGEALKLKSKQPPINYFATADFLNLMDLADFEVIRHEQRQLLPRKLLGLGSFVNRFIAPLPGIRRLCLRTYLVGRPIRPFPDRKLSASIVIHAATSEAISRAQSRECPGLDRNRRSFSSKAIPWMVPSRSASAFATSTGTSGRSK
jgi:SAM-dependent methyltransferase